MYLKDFNKRVYYTVFPVMFFYIIIYLSCDNSQGSLIKIQNKNQLDGIINEYVDKGYFPFLFVRLEDKGGSLIYQHCRINKKLIPYDTINEKTWIRIWSMS